MAELARFVVEHTLETLDRPENVTGVVEVRIEAPALDSTTNTTVLESWTVRFMNRKISLRLPAKDNPAFSSALARIYLTVRPHGAPAFSTVGIAPQLTREEPYRLADLLPPGGWPEVSEIIGGAAPDLGTAAIFPDSDYAGTYGGGI